MICRAAASGLPSRGQRPGFPTPPADERQRKGGRALEDDEATGSTEVADAG